MKTMLSIILSVLLSVFLGSVAIAEDSSNGNVWQGFHGPSISLSERTVTSRTSLTAEEGFYGPSISLSEKMDRAKMYFSALDHPCVVGGLLFDGPSISPSNSFVKCL